MLGSTYVKQVDVGLSDWMTGPEILISTKTMSRAFGKNLGNRFEEAYGDAKNLRGRHPLASLGFFFVINAQIAYEQNSLEKAVAMLDRLQRNEDAYDATSILLVSWNNNENACIAAENGKIPMRLSPELFFKHIIKTTLDRSAIDAHRAVRDHFPSD